VQVGDLAAYKAAITPKMRAIFVETIGNPVLEVVDIEGVAKVAHEAGLPLVIDNTFAAWLSQPIKYGADIVIHSLTKWIGGHGTAIGGVVVDAGKFQWKNNPRFPLMNDPDPNYHGLRWAPATCLQHWRQSPSRCGFAACRCETWGHVLRRTVRGFSCRVARAW
jgi:O-acetylhomoserine (thiol)-lyase